SVAVAVEENEDLARQRVLAQLVAHHDAQGVEALAQVAGAGGQTDLHAVGEDHRFGVGRCTRRTMPPPRSSSTRGPVCSRLSAAGPSASSTNSTAAPAFRRVTRRPRRQAMKVW